MTHDEPIGTLIGHFRIVRELGRGGMGVVYEADDEQLHRRVALKLLPPEMTGNRERRERFLREARSAARIAHPNIAAVYEIGEDGDGLYIAMEYVPGGSLRQHLRSGPLELPEVQRLARGISGALAKAHEAGIIHRDLKPENILLTEDGRVKLLDFGIAKALRPATGAPGLDDAVTGEGQILGTPGYMAPEQARGEPTDERTDVFAFGVVLYEMLGGAMPFRGNSPMESVAATLRDEPPSLTDLRHGLPGDLVELVHRCISKDPRERPRDGAAIVSALPVTSDNLIPVVRLAVAPGVDPEAKTALPTTSAGFPVAKPAVAAKSWKPAALLGGAGLILGGIGISAWRLGTTSTQQTETSSSARSVPPTLASNPSVGASEDATTSLQAARALRERGLLVTFPTYDGPGDMADVKRFMNDTVKAWIAKRKPLVEEATSTYKKALEANETTGGKAEERVQMAYEVTQMWSQFVHEFRNAPMPDTIRKDPALRKAYRQSLIDASKPQLDTALGAVKTCLQEAEEHHLVGGTVDLCHELQRRLLAEESSADTSRAMP